MSRVVITGLGLVSSIGNNVSETWDNLIAGDDALEAELNEINNCPSKALSLIHI